MNDSETPYQFKLWAQTSDDDEPSSLGDFSLNMLVDLV